VYFKMAQRGGRRKRKDDDPLSKQKYKEAVEACEDEWNLDVGRQIGAGAFSHVYLTTDKDGKNGALKICLLGKKTEKEKEYLNREVDVQKKFVDKYLVRLLDSAKFDEYVIIHMEYCEMTLTQYTRKYGIEATIPASIPGKKDTVIHVLDENSLRPIARDALRGLAHLNRMGYPHRDIKGDNILLARQPDGTYVAKLADFGMTKSPEEGKLGTMLGTPEYMAPEVRSVYTTGQSYDYRCDVWSMGITFYVTLVGLFPELLKDASVLDSIKYLSLPDIPKGRASTGKAWTPFSPICRHFIQSLLTKDFKDRLFSHETLKHPYLYPSINEIQLVVPDVSLNVMVCRNHPVMPGTIAFNNELKKRCMTKSSSTEAKDKAVEALLSDYPFNKIQWGLTWADFARNINLGRTSDFVVITDKGETFECGDSFEFDEENIMNVVVVPRRTSVSRVDPEVLAKSSSATAEKLGAMKADGNKVVQFSKELNTRFHFCYAAKRMEDYVLPLLNFDPIAERLKKRQMEVSRRLPQFPVAVFVPPPPASWKCSMSSEDYAQADALRKSIEECHAAAVRQSRRMTPNFTEELKKLSSLAGKWITPDFNPCMQNAIKSFNDVLDIIREHADAINRLLDYLEVLDLAEKDVSAATARLGKLVEGCPYLCIRSKQKILLRDDADDDDEIRELKQQMTALSKIIEEATQTNESLRKQNQDLMTTAGEAIQLYKNQELALREVLRQNGISVDLQETDSDPNTPMQVRRK